MTTLELSYRYIVAQLEKDQKTALKILLDDGLAEGFTVPELYLEVIQPAQYAIGRLWQAKVVTIAEEREATAISVQGLSKLHPFIPRAPLIGKRALVACVGGERHDLGARMVADFYEMAGFSVRFLGAGVDAATLVAVVKEDPPDLLGLSLTMPVNPVVFRSTVDRVRAAVGDGLQLAVGGAGSRGAGSRGTAVGADADDVDLQDSVARSVALLSPV